MSQGPRPPPRNPSLKPQINLPNKHQTLPAPQTWTGLVCMPQQLDLTEPNHEQQHEREREQQEREEQEREWEEQAVHRSELQTLREWQSRELSLQQALPQVDPSGAILPPADRADSGLLASQGSGRVSPFQFMAGSAATSSVDLESFVRGSPSPRSSASPRLGARAVSPEACSLGACTAGGGAEGVYAAGGGSAKNARGGAAAAAGAAAATSVGSVGGVSGAASPSYRDDTSGGVGSVGSGRSSPSFGGPDAPHLRPIFDSNARISFTAQQRVKGAGSVAAAALLRGSRAMRMMSATAAAAAAAGPAGGSAAAAQRGSTPAGKANTGGEGSGAEGSSDGKGGRSCKSPRSPSPRMSSLSAQQGAGQQLQQQLNNSHLTAQAAVQQWQQQQQQQQQPSDSGSLSRRSAQPAAAQQLQRHSNNGSLGRRSAHAAMQQQHEASTFPFGRRGPWLSPQPEQELSSEPAPSLVPKKNPPMTAMPLTAPSCQGLAAPDALEPSPRSKSYPGPVHNGGPWGEPPRGAEGGAGRAPAHRRPSTPMSLTRLLTMRRSGMLQEPAGAGAAAAAVANEEPECWHEVQVRGGAGLGGWRVWGSARGLTVWWV